MTLTANALACERNGRVVFSDLSFVLEPGSCAELRGPNGSGKSSLLRVLAGLVPAASGTLSLQGAEELPAHCHYIGHLDALKPAMTVAENLQFWADCQGGRGIDAALAAFALEPLRGEDGQFLSAGQRRRLSLSRLFVSDRPVWLLDEPMNALDAASQERLRQHIAAHRAKGGYVLAATHGDLGVPLDHVIALGAA